MQGLGMVGLVFIIGFYSVKMLLDKQQYPPERVLRPQPAPPVPPPPPVPPVPEPVSAPEPVVEAPAPALPKVTEQGIVCPICENVYKNLRQHLLRGHKLSVEAYRERFGLPADTPMTFPLK
ncbi:MAG: MucR family transcriptional regulator [Magnetococcales bacterium]|nr:MucR family transcriptional regulator [Magnetococcales bacterium]